MNLLQQLAVRASQAVLASVEPGLAIDGKWGDFTQAIFERVPLSVKQAVREALEKLNLSPESLYAQRQLDKQLAARGADGTLVSLVRSAAATAGIPVEELKSLVWIESRGKMKNSGSYYGMTQMSETSWAELKRTFRSIPSWATVKVEPLANLIAGAYSLLNASRAVKAFGISSLDNWERYMVHQQGAFGYATLRALALGLPLPVYQGKTRPITSVETAMRTNPPQDGRGVTTDPKQFITRWKSVYSGSQAAFERELG